MRPKDIALTVFLVSIAIVIIGGKMDDRWSMEAGGGGCFLIGIGLCGMLGSVLWTLVKLSGLAWSAL